MTETTFEQSWTSKLLKSITSVAGITIILAVVIAIGTSIMTDSPFILINTIVTGGMWALSAAGLSLVFGVMNIVNFAHGEMFMVGTLVAYYVFTPLRKIIQETQSPFLVAVSPFAAIIAAALAGALLGFLLELVVFSPLRKRSREQWVMNSFLLTVGISVILINGHQLLFNANQKGIPSYWDVEPLRISGVNISADRVVTFALALVTILAFWFFLRRTRVGRAIRAVSQDEHGAEMVGINLNVIQLLTLSLSGALAALAGASLLYIFPSSPTIGLRPLYIAWYVVIMSGLGNIAGAIAGGFIVALLGTLTSRFIGPGWDDVISTSIMMLILLIKPSGLFGSEVKGIHEQ